MPSKANIVEKILRDSEGRLVRASFCVYECGGRVKARLVSAVYLDEKLPIANKSNLLSSLTLSVNKYQKTVFVNKTVSPYFNSCLLNFLGSKPRAPTK